MFNDFQFIFTLILLGFCYYQVVTTKRSSYYDIDIINESITAYRTIGGGSDNQLAPFRDLLSEDPETKDMALTLIRHYHDISKYETRYICYGFVSYRFIRTDMKYLIEVEIHGNFVIIEVYNDDTVCCNNITLLTDMCIVLRENFTFSFYISMFSKLILDGPKKVLYSNSHYEDMQRLKRKGINSESYLIQNDIDFGLPHMKLETVKDTDIGILNDLYIAEVYIGGFHFKVYTDAESDTHYVNDSRVTRKQFIKLFRQGIKQWVLRNKQHSEKLRY